MNTLLSILQHALGRDEYGRRRHNASEDYRNHFCTGSGSDDFDLCSQAVALGLMTRHEPRVISGGDWIFNVTDAGKTYVTENSPAPPRISRAKKRYLQYLGSVAADLGTPFGDWLKAGAYNGHR